MAEPESEIEVKSKKYKFRSESQRTVVYRDGKVAAEFSDHTFETDDDDLAAFLEKRGYQQWDLITQEDVIVFDDGAKLSIKELFKTAPELAKELIGLPKMLAKKTISEIPGFRKEAQEPEGKPKDVFICEHCGRDDFKSQPALNGHKANCPEKPK